ncbi:hypothetical protein BDZ88DRAFT_406598 [Geranomyces variabilis]|nr:hypothetical protein BDZ88DRAFT_406598 [Geranomyces variabilis]
MEERVPATPPTKPKRKKERDFAVPRLPSSPSFLLSFAGTVPLHLKFLVYSFVFVGIFSCFFFVVVFCLAIVRLQKGVRSIVFVLFEM